MRTKLQIIGTILFVLSAAVLGTIYLAWLVYPLEISFWGWKSDLHEGGRYFLQFQYPDELSNKSFCKCFRHAKFFILS